MQKPFRSANCWESVSLKEQRTTVVVPGLPVEEDSTALTKARDLCWPETRPTRDLLSSAAWRRCTSPGAHVSLGPSVSCWMHSYEGMGYRSLMQENGCECEAQTVAVLGRNTCCEAGRSFWVSPQCMRGLVAPQFRKVVLKMLEMGKSHWNGRSIFHVAVTEEMLNHPVQNGAPLSLNLLAPVQAASVPPLQKSAPPPPASCLITWKSNRLYILLPSCLIFVIDFPPFGTLRGILAGSQAGLRWPP